MVAFIYLFMCSFIIRKGNYRARGEDGERQAEESEEAPDDLLQLPAGRPAEALPEHTVPGAAGESRAGCLAGAHANTGGISFPLNFPLNLKKNISMKFHFYSLGRVGKPI